MFQNTLLIIKADYMYKRKAVLLHVLQHGFQIQTNRRLAFSPEHAAEFYKDIADQKSFMLQVILLSKGNAEAFILTRQNSVADLLQKMICYFGSSIEMERNVHVSQSDYAARRDISYIFPNFIHEPLQFFDGSRFCQKPLINSLINELYHISTAEADKQSSNWRVQLAEWLMLTNRSVPRIINQCSTKYNTRQLDKSQQVRLPDIKEVAEKAEEEPEQVPSGSFSSAGSSMVMSSSSCISCTGFDGSDSCKRPPPSPTKVCEQMVMAKTVELPNVEEEEPQEHGEGIHWIEGDSDECSDDALAALMVEEEFENQSDAGE